MDGSDAAPTKRRGLANRWHNWRVERAIRTRGQPPWRRHWYIRLRTLAMETLIFLLAFLLLFWYGQPAGAHLLGFKPLTVNSDVCADGRCDALAGLAKTVLLAALAAAIFLVWRLHSAKRPIRYRARKEARDFVPTAKNSIMEDVIGRDELCEVIVQELKNRDGRRPHLLIGGVGAGKTAVMVHLTEVLARHGAVPVPVRLRDVTGELDFAELGRDAYCQEVDEATLMKGWAVQASGGQAWRWLRKQDRVVVLADGLEEVFSVGEDARDRDNRIRNAIRTAKRNNLPLVMASRPHAPLRDVEAAITELEPLSEEAAVLYVEEAGLREDEHRIDWVVEDAEVSEAPLYLQVARQLYRHGRLEHIAGRADEDTLETRHADRAGLRHNLLKTWVNAVISGHLMRQLALTRDRRRDAVRQIAALAWIGLQRDSLEVRFDDLVPSREGAGPPALPGPVDTRGQGHQDSGRAGHYAPILAELARQLSDRPRDQPRSRSGRRADSLAGRTIVDLPLAATWGEQMRLVEAHGDRVRFQHSIMQAYLGSRFVAEALAAGKVDTVLCDEFLQEGLNAGPSREFLLALVFLSREVPWDQAGELHRRRVESCVRTLCDAADDRHSQRADEKSLDIYTAALEIDFACNGAQLAHLTDSIVKRWRTLQSRDEQGLKDAKLRLVHRLGDIARRRADDARAAHRDPLDDMSITGAYRALFDIALDEPVYGVRLAVAEEIGCGGDPAFVALEHEIAATGCQAGRAVVIPAGPDAGRAQRRRIVCAWLGPMLLACVSDRRMPGGTVLSVRDRAQAVLVGLLAPARAALVGDRGGTPRMLMSQEVALAQGFKAAANRRARHFATTAEGRSILIELAEELLKASTYWYTQLTLLHALTLWALHDTTRGTADHELVATPASWANKSPKEKVDRWLADAGTAPMWSPPGAANVGSWPSWPTRGWLLPARARKHRRRLHPFVFETGELVSKALLTGHPERYLWIDEMGVVNKVGSRPGDPDVRRVHNLWIPPSTGWTALDRRAERLVADVLLLLNLTEQDQPAAQERHMRRATRRDLPPCLTGDRAPLQPSLSIANPDRTSRPGISCSAGCPFELCPYPSRGTPRREEFGEAFCREQATLLRPRLRNLLGLGPAPWQRSSLRPWQRARIRDLRRFWRDMADRRRVPPVDDLLG